MKNKLRILTVAVGLALAAMPAAAATHTSDNAATDRLANQIRRELVTLPFYSVFDNFAFQIDGSTVTLRGQVSRPTLKTSAERVVARLEGVSAVDNRIEVLPVSFHDNRLRQELLYSIYGHPVLDRYALGSVPSIHIIVRNGHVTLEGVVAREMEKNVAFLQANGVSGVFSVTNNLRVDKS